MFELPERVTTTRDGHVFYRDFTYADDSYNHFGQPTTIADFGDFSRSTTLTYRHFSGAHWLSDRVATETIDGTAFTSSWQYDGDTGFLLSQTLLGVTTGFAPDGAGNVATRTDANNHANTLDYDWGVPSAVHTPQYTAEYGINDNGRTGWARQRGQTTSFEYVGLGRQTMAHELYGHVFLYLSGLSWTHVNPWVSAWISSVLAGAVQSITGSI